jgi:hypothetical protein
MTDMNNLAARFGAVLWWALPLAALAALLGWETDWGSAVESIPQPAEATAPEPVVASLLPDYVIAGGVAARAETVQRTLFNPTRRPAPPMAQDGGPGRLQRGQFALTGTTVAQGKNTAFLREVAGNKSRRVQAGETINGILVTEVAPDRVKLVLGDETEELVLKVATNPRPTVAPVAVPAAVAPGVPAQPATGAAQDAAQTLAERRRAARAAAAAAPPAPPVAAPAAPVAPAVGIDPRWGQMDQAYRDRAAGANRSNTQ